jgi:hypothetical protein
MGIEQVREKFVNTVTFAGPTAAQAVATYQAWMSLPQSPDIRQLSWPDLHAKQETT